VIAIAEIAAARIVFEQCMVLGPVVRDKFKERNLSCL